MRYWRSGVISHQVCNHEILWIWRNMKYAVMRYCGFVMIHFVELDHSEQSDQQDQSGYTSASSDRFRSCLPRVPPGIQSCSCLVCILMGAI